jgi:dsDNA-binding SOS-regulon protein
MVFRAVFVFVVDRDGEQGTWGMVHIEADNYDGLNIDTERLRSRR